MTDDVTGVDCGHSLDIVHLIGMIKDCKMLFSIFVITTRVLCALYINVLHVQNCRR